MVGSRVLVPGAVATLLLLTACHAPPSGDLVGEATPSYGPRSDVSYPAYRAEPDYRPYYGDGRYYHDGRYYRVDRRYDVRPDYGSYYVGRYYDGRPSYYSYRAPSSRFQDVGTGQ